MVVVGTSGAGKSRFASRLARATGARHIELDAFKHGPNWTERSQEEMRRRTAEAIGAADTWVVDGNYTEVRDVVWPRATTLVWLDYSKPLVMSRIIRRSLGRVVMRTELWNGNRSDWRRWGDPTHPIRWAWSTHAYNRVRYESVTALPEWSHLEVVRLRRPREARALLFLNG